MRTTDVLIGTRICQRPECGKEFDIGYGGGRVEYCLDCRIIVMTKRHREQGRKMRGRIKKANEGHSKRLLLPCGASAVIGQVASRRDPEGGEK